MVYFSLGKAMSVLQKAFDTMDNRLEGHGERVAYIVWKLLKESNKYDEESIIKLVVLAFFHDIGAYKTNKVDKLLNFEIDSPHDHAIYGYLYLKHLSPFNDDIDVILYHHLKVKKLKELKSENLDKPLILHFADRLDILIRSEIDMSFENINALAEGVIESDKIETFIEVNSRLKICENLISGEYRKELMDYLSTYKFEEKYLIEILKMLVFIIDFRSPHTVIHSIYVWLISELICDILKLEEDKKEEVALAALFHDIGKITTPVSILEKKGKLTFVEMEIMKQHVVESKNIVEGLGLSKIANILGMHHEKLDGSGYPDGICGKDIPYESRIIMAVDIFSALIGERSYKNPYEKEEAIDILINLAISKKLDENIVKVIVDNYDYLVNKSKEKATKYIEIFDLINNEYNLLIKNKIFKE